MYYSKCDQGYVIRLEIGEEIQETLRQFAYNLKIEGAFYQGIGAVTNVELAFFCTETKHYDCQYFNEEYELISLMGNLSSHNGSILPHTHVALGGRDFRTIGGHLVRAQVSVTAEIILTPIDLALGREEDPMLKFKGLISPKRVRLKIDV